MGRPFKIKDGTITNNNGKRVIVHRNKWWWGNTTSFIEGHGYGQVEVQFDDSWNYICYIRGLIVFTPHRKKGLGSKLLDLAIDEARHRGMKFVKLDANKDEKWLVEWYERRGFYRVSFDEHEYTMIKVL